MPPQKDSTTNTANIRRVLSESDISVDTTSSKSYRDYTVRKSSLIGIINWTQVAISYMPHVFLSGIGLLIALIFHQVMSDILATRKQSTTDTNVFFSLDLWLTAVTSIQDLFHRQKTVLLSLRTKEAIFSPAVETTFVALLIMAWILLKDNPVYLLSFSTFKPPISWKVSHDQIMEMMKRQKCYTQDSLDFMRRLLERSGTGQSTAWPPGIVQCLRGEHTDRSIEASRQEAKTILFQVVEQALKEAHVSPRDIDVLVINCSLFSPTPSLCAMVINHFHMRQDILSYNLSGMGCGASLLALDLARNTLQAKYRKSIRGGKALVVSTEIITPNLYHGNERGFLLQNTLFRCGGAAIVLSNNWMDGSRAWFKLLHLVRVQGTSDESYHCVYESEDTDGHRGVSLSKDIVLVAGKTMEKNMGTLGPSILPLTEQIKVGYSIAARFLLKSIAKWTHSKHIPMVKLYVPDFKRGIDHFCIHAGGRAVIDGIEKNMRLEPFHTEPSRMTLLNYGNTSSSSIWYELEYIMIQQRTNPLKKGHRVMQVAFGSGFKCTSGVWLKL